MGLSRPRRVGLQDDVPGIGSRGNSRREVYEGAPRCSTETEEREGNNVDSLHYEAQKITHIFLRLVPGVARIGKQDYEMLGPTSWPTCTIIRNRVVHMGIDETTRDLKEKP